MLAGAGGATRAGLRDVDLVDRLETTGGVASQHAREARREPGTDHHGDPPLGRLRIQVQQPSHVVHGVTHRHDGLTPAHEGRRGLDVRAGRAGQDHDVGVHGLVVAGQVDLGVIPERLTQRDDPVTALLAQHDAFDAFGRHELAGEAGADGAESEDGESHRAADQVSSESDNSRQPPSCGGVPPVPRIRSTAATMPAMPRATNARRNIFMDDSLPARTRQGRWTTTAAPRVRRRGNVGLVGIEPTTSPLSGVRSNRLSYSPGSSEGEP